MKQVAMLCLPTLMAQWALTGVAMPIKPAFLGTQPIAMLEKVASEPIVAGELKAEPVNSKPVVAGEVKDKSKTEPKMLNEAPAKSEKKEAEAEPQNKTAPKPTEAPKPRGHFYYSDSCGDCFYKGVQCGCGPAMEYLACVTTHCTSSKEPAFADACVKLQGQCTGELDIKCMGPATGCAPKFNQLPIGGIGFTAATSADNAYCGPFGKCIGKYRITVNVHRPAPPNSSIASPAPAAPAAPAPIVPPASPVWVECGFTEDKIKCYGQVLGDTARCQLPMSKQTIEAGESTRAYCVLTDGKGGTALTAKSWMKLTNVHAKTDAAAEPAPEVAAPKPKPPPKPKEKEAPKPPKPQPAPKPVAAAPKDQAGSDGEAFPPWMENNQDKKPAPPI